MATDFYPRHISRRLLTALDDTPVVCLIGPRQSGKTTLAKQLAPQRHYVNFDDHSLMIAAKRDPLGFVLALQERVTLDEMQRVPELFPAIKIAVDDQRTSGRFLLTGSANLLLQKNVQESLAGRVEIMNLFPLTRQEQTQSSTSLLSLLLDNKIKQKIQSNQQASDKLADALCRGGYPEAIKRGPQRVRQWHRQYLNAIIQRDVKDIAAIRDEFELLRLMELLSIRTATLLNISSMANELSINRITAEKYLNILERLFLIRRLPAWHKNKAKRLVKTPKVYILDSGLAASLSGLTPDAWYQQSTPFGNLLESFVVQELICQASWLDDDLKFYHYRDKDQVEVDLVIERHKEIWGIEVKKASSLHAKDGDGLARLATHGGKQFRGGIVLYNGASTLPLAHNNCFAVPMSRL